MADVVRVAMNMMFPLSAANSIAMTTHVGWAGGAEPTDAQLDALADLFGDWWVSGVGGELALRTWLTGDAQLANVTVQRIFPTPADTARTLEINSQGALVVNGLPPQCAIVISERTATASRRARGRMYTPGVPESVVDEAGIITASHAQGIADSAKGLISAIPALNADWGWIVWSRVASVGYPITAVRVGRKVDIQRRRKVPGEIYVTGT